MDDQQPVAAVKQGPTAWGELCADVMSRVLTYLTIHELAQAASAGKDFALAFRQRVAETQESFITSARDAYGQPLIDTLALVIRRFCLGLNLYSGLPGFGPPKRAWIAADGTFGLEQTGAKAAVSMKSADAFSVDLQPGNKADLREEPHIRFVRRCKYYYEVLMNVGDLEQAGRGLGLLLAACAQPSVKEVLPGVTASRSKLDRTPLLAPLVRTNLYRIKSADPAFSCTEALTAGVIPLAACLGDVGVVVGCRNNTVSVQTKITVFIPDNLQVFFALPPVFKEAVVKKQSR